MSEKKLVFMFEGKPVGCFEESEYPIVDGTYRYTPLRGPGHYEMQNKLISAEKAHCYYEISGKVIEFNVADCPENGVLELQDFDAGTKTGD